MTIEQKYQAEIKLFGNQIREIKKAKNLTQKQLKALCGIRQSQISLLEKATQNPNPAFDTLVKLAYGFKTHIASLFAYSPKQAQLPFRKRYSSIEDRTQAEKKEFGKRVEELCEHRKLNQYELAILAKIDAADLSRHINGQGNIEFYNVLKLALALEVRMFDLFDYNGSLPDNRGFSGKL
jgi:transcriptional regulator with XRE-family HTH domain